MFIKKKRLVLFTALLFLFNSGIIAQAGINVANQPKEIILQTDESVIPFAQTISAEDLKKHLFTLASSEFEGRETGQPGQKKAAEYISRQFQSYGLPKIGDDGSYFQKIAFVSEKWEEIQLSINGTVYKHLRDYYALPSDNNHQPLVQSDEVLFLGYGIDDPAYSDYNGNDVEGKTILIYQGEPVNKKGISFLTGTRESSDWSNNMKKKLETAHKHGVNNILFIDAEVQKNIGKYRSRILDSSMKMKKDATSQVGYANNAFISTGIAKNIVGKNFKKLIKARKKIQKAGKPISVAFPCKLELVQKKKERRIQGENVLGYIEGTDEELKNEIVVVTAHYDHLGKRGEAIYFGADDNASGTSSVLEVCQAFAEAKKQGIGPRRSVLLMLVSGEEKGLLGSKFYSEYPLFPLENTVANVNVDMVGRVDKKHEENPDYIYVIGADRISKDLHHINEAVNDQFTQLELDYTYNSEKDPNRYYYRSDHYNFAKKGIPVVFYFNGTHQDYHRTSDTAEKINFEKMEKIARLVFYTSWELANRDQRLRMN
ncbi:MAG: M28 family peptidase [Bacteroidetes bacterium]|nr:M28 family peptidase [Bacteroidota bacterium]